MNTVINKAFSARGYDHQTVIRTAYLWLPLFAVVIFVCSYFEKYRFILYISVVGATYAFILGQLKKKAVEVNFCKDKITVNSAEIRLSEIKSYYISLPLNELIVLRMRTGSGDKSIYIDKNKREHITEFLKVNHIPEEKISYDYYLQYGHLIMPFAGLLICAAMYKLYYYIQYGF
ncbi:hypothetical protein [Chryseobacterium hagamense]|uniref:DUF304 domain-containing protein n=1 Tax=Chryseobacterium hagamense TaxID=395935 RepID=A0A511YQT9_9FLAO|nr:hypothetical protein [Chryseobacterium hagamense]GEN77556.1 hypothetical protein CHA01nite_32960 [Chryseobacterium hagamense]